MNLIFTKNIIISWGKTLGAQVWHLVNIKIQNWTCSSSFRTARSDLKSYCAPIISKLKQVERFQKVLNHFKKFLNRLGTKMKGRVQISGGRVQFWEIRNICPKNGQKWPKTGHLRSCSGLFRGGGKPNVLDVPFFWNLYRTPWNLYRGFQNGSEVFQ